MKFFIGEWFADNAIMTSYLDQVQFYTGSYLRQNRLSISPKIGGSMLYGLTWRGPWMAPGKYRTPSKYPKLFKTKVMDDYPELEEIFREFGEIYFPAFNWSQTQMNKNYPCPPHKDNANIGSSILCCFGDYEGGHTLVDYGEKTGIQKLDARAGWVKFNGAKYTHWVEPIKSGTRYALVFFANSSIDSRKKIL